MRAVVLNGHKDVSVEDVPDAGVPGPDGLLLRVERTAICGSDLHLYHAPAPGPGATLGHEFVGTVEDTGTEVHTVRTGDRVLVSAVLGCGACAACRARDPVVCGRRGVRIFGNGAMPGGQAEAVAVPAGEASVLPVPEWMTVEQAVLLTDILPTAYIGAERADITPGDTVVVLGLGPVGTLAVQCAQLFGAARVLAADMVPERLANADRLGAHPVDARGGTVVEQVREPTHGWGAGSVIEAVGADASVLDALALAAPGGTVSVIGVNLNMQLPFPTPQAFMKRLTVRVSLASVPSVWAALVPLLEQGRLRPDDVFTHHLGLSDASEAYRLFDAREDGVLKVLLDPAG